jgi:uncharacterized membrane protein YphA (DoxX/SURF4 family)
MTEREEKTVIRSSAIQVFLTQRLPAALLAELYRALRLGLAAIFILAGFLKLRDPGAFAHAIAQYDLVPNGAIPVLAIGLPAVELLAGLGLMLDLKGSLTVIAGLMLFFVGVLGYAILNDLDIECGCFTLEELRERTTVKQAFYRDLIMLAAIAFLYRWRRIRLQGISKNFP